MLNAKNSIPLTGSRASRTKAFDQNYLAKFVRGREQENGDCTKRSESANGDGTVPFYCELGKSILTSTLSLPANEVALIPAKNGDRHVSARGLASLASVPAFCSASYCESPP